MVSPHDPSEREAERIGQEAATSPYARGAAMPPDLISVRIHADDAAAHSAAALGARAYTIGHHVVFGRSEYRPDMPSGRALLAHELTHVLQQSNPGTRPVIQRAPAGTSKARLESPSLAPDRRVQAAFHNNPPLKQGEVSEGVKTLQRALHGLGFPMPISFAKTGDADGIFGPETRATVLQFQREQELSMQEGIAGHETLGRLDEVLGAPPVPPAPPGPLPGPPTPTPPVPPARAVTLALKALTFRSDHGVMRDEKVSWEKGTNLFPKPEWTDTSPGRRSAPISHDHNRTVALDAELEASPEGAGTAFELRGASRVGFLSFKSAGTLRAGRQVVPMVSDAPTPNPITAVHEQAIDWVAVVSGRRQHVGLSLGHEVFVTMGPPREPDEVTYKRMALSVRLAGSTGTLVPQDLVRGIMMRFGRYNLHVQLLNAWTLADRMGPPPGGGAQCIDIVRFVQGIIHQIGCPGVAEAKLIWAKPEDPLKAQESPSTGPSLFGYHPHPSHPTWFAALIDISACPNNFEAALKFTESGTRYYPGGVSLVASDGRQRIFLNADEVVRIFQFLVWRESVPGSASDFFIQEVLANYRNRRVPALPFRTACDTGRLG